MSLRIYLAAGLVLCLASCSSTVDDEEPIVFNHATKQLPAEPRYSTTAWVQPPTVVPSRDEQSGFGNESEAPLLKPADAPVRTVPKLPPAASAGRRY